MTETPEKFARLEDTPHGQILITIQSSVDGPTIEFRLAERRNCEPRLKRGPWPETDAGWAEARDIFESMDLQVAADELVQITDQAIARASAIETPEARDWAQRQRSGPHIKDGRIQPDEAGD